MEWPDHGGQPDAIRRKFDFAIPEDMIDFSANINPFGPPGWMGKELVNHFEQISRYPDPSYREARKQIALSEGMDTEQVLVTNGGAEAIFLVAKMFEKKRAVIVQPTFLEYERACLHYHLSVEDVFFSLDNEFELSMEAITIACKNRDVVFLCRPNNPTGTVVAEKTIYRLMEEAKKSDTYVVVDEAFADFLPESVPSLAQCLTEYDNLIILRSMTKMFAVPGLRIGYILSNSDFIKKAKQWQIPWSVNTLAAAVVPKMIADKGFVNDTKKWLAEEITFLRHQMNKLNFYMSATQVNYYLLQDLEQPDEMMPLYEYLLKAGIVARHTTNFKGLEGNYLRFAIRSRQENNRLLQALASWRGIQ